MRLCRFCAAVLAVLWARPPDAANSPAASERYRDHAGALFARGLARWPTHNLRQGQQPGLIQVAPYPAVPCRGPSEAPSSRPPPRGVTALKTTIWAAAQSGAFPAQGHLNRLSLVGDRQWSQPAYSQGEPEVGLAGGCLHDVGREILDLLLAQPTGV